LLGTLGAVSALLCGDIAAARRHLDTIARQTPRGDRRLAVAHCAHLSAFASLLEGDLTLALEGAKSAVRTITALGALVPEALSRLLLAEIHAARGELTEAEAVLTELRKVGGAPESAFVESQVQFIEARISDHRGQRDVTLAHVSRALSLAGRFGTPLLLTFLTTPESFARLCALAMSENIEVAAAQALVRARPLGGFAPRASLVSWPWLLRVQLLGTFRVELDGKDLLSVGKQQARVLELLQLLVVEGGSAPESTLSDRLWPEAEGDKAEQALTITLHRLRALLGDPSLVVRRAGEVALDRTRVFADLWAIDALLEDVRRAERATDRKEAERAHALAEALYAGSPTPVRRGSPPEWLIAEGDRLEARFAQTAQKSAEKRPN
jgi:LuxR family maltose regulon positive regulatory protein